MAQRYASVILTKVKVKVSHLMLVAKQVKTAVLHRPTVSKSLIAGIKPATFCSETLHWSLARTTPLYSFFEWVATRYSPSRVFNTVSAFTELSNLVLQHSVVQRRSQPWMKVLCRWGLGGGGHWAHRGFGAKLDNFRRVVLFYLLIYLLMQETNNFTNFSSLAASWPGAWHALVDWHAIKYALVHYKHREKKKQTRRPRDRQKKESAKDADLLRCSGKQVQTWVQGRAGAVGCNV